MAALQDSALKQGGSAGASTSLQSSELARSHSRSRSRPPTEAACVEFLRGPAFHCPVSDSCADLPARGLLQVVDHSNLRHHQEEWEADLLDVKRCECGYFYLDTAVGKACHIRW